MDGQSFDLGRVDTTNRLTLGRQLDGRPLRSSCTCRPWSQIATDVGRSQSQQSAYASEYQKKGEWKINNGQRSLNYMIRFASSFFLSFNRSITSCIGSRTNTAACPTCLPRKRIWTILDSGSCRADASTPALPKMHMSPDWQPRARTRSSGEKAMVDGRCGKPCSIVCKAQTNRHMKSLFVTTA